jgi:outer membrane protein OmpA-like peptidoglycan-associated protein
MARRLPTLSIPVALIVSTLIVGSGCRRPLFVSHLSPEGIALTKKKGYGMPVHHFFSRIICFQDKCRNKAAWVKEQKRHRFQGFVDHRKKKDITPAAAFQPAAPALAKKDSVTASKPDIVVTAPRVDTTRHAKERKFVLSEVLFAHNSSRLEPASFFQLDSLAEYLTSSPTLSVKINGHTDNTGREPRNLKLSRDRAQAVAEYLIQRNIDMRRISFEGFGSSRPIADNTTEGGRQKNRRVEILLIGN